jgi:hypothetical protein
MVSKLITDDDVPIEVNVPDNGLTRYRQDGPAEENSD